MSDIYFRLLFVYIKYYTLLCGTQLQERFLLVTYLKLNITIMKKKAIIRGLNRVWYLESINYHMNAGEKVTFSVQELIKYANENDICITNKTSLIDKYAKQLKN